MSSSSVNWLRYILTSEDNSPFGPVKKEANFTYSTSKNSWRTCLPTKCRINCCSIIPSITGHSWGRDVKNSRHSPIVVETITWPNKKRTIRINCSSSIDNNPYTSNSVCLILQIPCSISFESARFVNKEKTCWPYSINSSTCFVCKRVIPIRAIKLWSSLRLI